MDISAVPAAARTCAAPNLWQSCEANEETQATAFECGVGDVAHPEQNNTMSGSGADRAIGANELGLAAGNSMVSALIAHS
jgi:hypothetical protein